MTPPNVYHQAPDFKAYTGRAEPFENGKACYWYQHIQAFDDALNQTNNQKNQPKIALLGFACDQGVNRNQGRIGAKYAPDAIKSSFAKLPISYQTQQNFQSMAGIVVDAGNVVCDDDDTICPNLLEIAQQDYADKISTVLNANALPIGLGGGHEIAWGSFLGLWQHMAAAPTPLANIGIINLDAHFDLRQDQYATSGTPFRQIAEHLDTKEQPFHYLCIGISQFSNTASLYERAFDLGVSVIGDDDCHRLDWQAIEQKILAFIAPLDVIYLTIDMDCLAGSVMPAVSAVAAKGLSLDFVERCVLLIINTGKVKVIDMAEVSPKYDSDGRGLKVAGRLLAVMVEAVLSSSFKSSSFKPLSR